MKKGIWYYCQEFWNQLKRVLADKCGELTLGDLKPKTERSEMKIGKTLYIVTSRYSGKENIMDKFKRLIVRKLESQSKNVTSAEALLRWDYSLEKQKNIGEIIQIAEGIGLINEITKFVMKKVIEQIGKWQGEGVTIKVALNMSLKDLRDDSLVIFLEESIKANNIPPSMIEIELTERGILENEKTTLIFLKRLKKLGIEIALDDFGTGYNSMIDLVRLPIDYVKIDKAFIDDITNEIHRTLIESIISYSHRTGKKAIAEGVETKEQLDILKRMGCDYIQGYYFCKPVLPEDLKKYILH